MVSTKGTRRVGITTVSNATPSAHQSANQQRMVEQGGRKQRTALGAGKGADSERATKSLASAIGSPCVHRGDMGATATKHHR